MTHLDRFILLLVIVSGAAYVAFRHPSVRDPLLVGLAVGTLMLGVMVAQ